jgi:hypothetical protein
MPQPEVARNLTPRAPLPSAARRYLAYAITRDAPEAHSFQIAMRGELKSHGRWLPFRADQWLHPATGVEWRAVVSLGSVRIMGRRLLLDGYGESHWGILDDVAFTMQGPHVTRCTTGSVALESLWAPTWLASPAVTWSENPDGSVRARWWIGRTCVAIDLIVDPSGRPRSVWTTRWGNPDGQGWRLVRFGARIDADRVFAGLRVPARLTAGWWFGDDRFEREGVNLRVTVDRIEPARDEPTLPKENRPCV